MALCLKAVGEKPSDRITNYRVLIVINGSRIVENSFDLFVCC